MLPVADELHEAGYGVFTFDQRGSGKSTGETTFGAREQDDLISVVDYLVSRPDVDRDRLGAFGFSMGGATTLLTAAREPRLKAVVADSAWSDVRRWLRPSVSDVFVHPRDRFTALSLKLAELRTGTDLDDLRPAEVIDRISPRPLLLVHGSGDEVIPAAEAERNFEAAKEPKKLVVVPGAGHGETIAPGSRRCGATSSSSSTAPSSAQGRPSHGASPWTKHEEVPPPMPELTRGESRGLGRLTRYTNLIRRSLHFKFALAGSSSSVLPEFASGIIRARIYRWAGFDIGQGASHGQPAAEERGARLLQQALDRRGRDARGDHDQPRRQGDDRQERRHRAARRDLHGSHQIGPGSKRIGDFTALRDDRGRRLGARRRDPRPRSDRRTRSILAAGAVVLKDVPPNAYVEGNPAQVVRQLPWGYR